MLMCEKVPRNHVGVMCLKSLNSFIKIKINVERVHYQIIFSFISILFFPLHSMFLRI